jgi:cytochrome c6
MTARPWAAVAAPVLAGLCAAAVAFAVVMLAARDETRPATTPAAIARGGVAADAARGRAVFAAAGCGSCHRLVAAGSEGQIGPPLDQVLPSQTRASLRAKILDPGASSIMPDDFGRRLSDGDLDALVAFLLASRGPAP